MQEDVFRTCRTIYITLSFGFEPQTMALLNLRVVVLLMICRMSRLNMLEHSTCAQTCTCRVPAISMDLSQQFPRFGTLWRLAHASSTASRQLGCRYLCCEITQSRQKQTVPCNNTCPSDKETPWLTSFVWLDLSRKCSSLHPCEVTQPSFLVGEL